nr:hypothetical protein [Arcobacter sp. F155]
MASKEIKKNFVYIQYPLCNKALFCIINTIPKITAKTKDKEETYL